MTAPATDLVEFPPPRLLLGLPPDLLVALDVSKVGGVRHRRVPRPPTEAPHILTAALPALCRDVAGLDCRRMAYSGVTYITTQSLPQQCVYMYKRCR